jgi:hypothetical protein
MSPNTSANIQIAATNSIPHIHHLSAGKGRDQPGHKKEEEEETPQKRGFRELPEKDSNLHQLIQSQTRHVRGRCWALAKLLM